ncbi:MAG: hypothetical protein KDK36_06940 [Leptospiraceae bacterium]|nr:hypothetical protein [Leptospiraceae bacterium]
MTEGKKNFVRIWKHLDTEEVDNHLLLIEDLYGSCFKCKKLGLNYLKDKTCPSCGTKFKYLATKLKDQGEIIKILNKIQTNNLELLLIERDDYNKAQARDALKDLFK